MKLLKDFGYYGRFLVFGKHYIALRNRRFHFKLRHPAASSWLTISYILDPKQWRRLQYGIWAVEFGWWFECGPFEIRRFKGGLKSDFVVTMANAMLRPVRRQKPYTGDIVSGKPGSMLPGIERHNHRSNGGFVK